MRAKVMLGTLGVSTIILNSESCRKGHIDLDVYVGDKHNAGVCLSPDQTLELADKMLTTMEYSLGIGEE